MSAHVLICERFSCRLRDLNSPNLGTNFSNIPVKRITRQTSATNRAVLQTYNRNQIQAQPAVKKKITAPGKGDDALREVIMSEVLDRRPSVRWDDVAGLSKAKQVC